jgi:hypothetical protein
VEHGEGADPAAEEVGIGAQASERREGSPEEDRQERVKTTWK